MIDPSMTDLIDTSPEVIASFQRDLAQARGKIDEMTVAAANYRDTIRGFEYRIESVKSYIIEQMTKDNIDEETAQDIASILGFELEKEVFFTVTVQISGTARVAPDEDAESLITNMEFSMHDNYNSLDFDVDDVNITDVDISEA